MPKLELVQLTERHWKGQRPWRKERSMLPGMFALT